MQKQSGRCHDNVPSESPRSSPILLSSWSVEAKGQSLFRDLFLMVFSHANLTTVFLQKTLGRSKQERDWLIRSFLPNYTLVSLFSKGKCGSQKRLKIWQCQQSDKRPVFLAGFRSLFWITVPSLHPYRYFASSESSRERISSLLPRFQSNQDNGRADRTSASIPYSHENPRQRPNYCFSRCIKKPGGK